MKESTKWILLGILIIVCGVIVLGSPYVASFSIAASSSVTSACRASRRPSCSSTSAMRVEIALAFFSLGALRPGRALVADA